MTQQFHFQTPKRKAYVSKMANVNSSFIYSSPDQETTYLFINRVRKQLQYVHTVEYHSAIKKEHTTGTCNNMDGSKNHVGERNT